MRTRNIKRVKTITFINEELGDTRKDYMDVLYKRWCQAEDLAYLVAIAEDVSVTTRANVTAAGAAGSLPKALH